MYEENIKQQLFYNLFIEAPLALSISSMEGKIQLVNKFFSKMFGYSEKELIGCHFREITHPKDISGGDEFYQKLIEGELVSYEIEKRYISKSQDSLWGRLYVSLIKSTEGQPLYILCIIQDITDRKTAEQALLNSEKRYKAVLDNSKDLICRYSDNFTLTYSNKSFLEFFNLSNKDIGNLNVLDLYQDKEDIERFKSLINLHQINNEPISRRVKIDSPKGERWQEWITTGIYSDEGSLLEIQSIGRDITKEIEEKEQIQGYNKLLTQYAKELNQANGQLASLTRLFDSVQRNTKTGIWNLDLSSDHIFWSDELYRIHELDEKKKLTIEEALSYYAIEHQVLVREIFYDAIQQKKEFDYELRIITAKNNLRWVRVIASPVIEKGELISVQGIFQDITEKKLAQLKAQERQENINAIIENTNDHIWSIDKNYKLIIANNAFKKFIHSIWGREITEGQSILMDEFPSEIIKIWKSFYDRALSGESFKTERHLRKDNSLVLHVSFSPIYENGKVVGANIISRDISDVKKKEAEIERQREFLLQVQSEAKIAAWRRNYLTNTLEYTETLKEIFEFEEGEVHSSNILDVMNTMVHPDDQERIEPIIKRVRTTEDKSVFVETRIITKKGNTKYIRVIGGEPYKDPTSGATILSGSTQDITSFKLQEQRLLDNEQRVKALTYNSSLAVAVADFDGSILEYNNVFRDKFGYSSKELKGLNFKLLTHPDDQAHTAHYMKQLKDGNIETCQTEKRYLRKDGKVIWGLLNISVVKDTKQQPIYAIGQLQDITIKKSEESKIKKIVEERTSQLEAINNELEAFTYSVSHDLRAPLRSVNGFSEALLEDYGDVLDDDGKVFLNKIYDASVRMGHLIDDLLHLSRISKYECHKQKVNLSLIAQKVISGVSIKDVYSLTKFNIEDELWADGDEIY
ncbi:MAG: PAS domain-containing sensor histidine kinase [Candidatus Cyclobacteriaceae bacterium M2_1C_046]